MPPTASSSKSQRSVPPSLDFFSTRSRRHSAPMAPFGVVATALFIAILASPKQPCNGQEAAQKDSAAELPFTIPTEMQEIIRELEASAVAPGEDAAQGRSGGVLGTARRMRPIRNTASAIASEVQGLLQTPTFRYGERTSPSSMMTDFRGTIARMAREHGALMSQQVIGLQAKMDTILAHFSEARRLGRRVDTASLVSELLYLFCTPTLLQRPGPVPGAVHGPLWIARIETESCTKAHKDDIKCNLPKIEITKVKSNIHLPYLAPTVAVTPQCGQSMVFGGLSETVLWERSQPMRFESMADFQRFLKAQRFGRSI